MNTKRIWMSTVICLMAWAISGVAVALETFTENFSAVTYKDTSATTADWVTATGNLESRPFELSIVGSVDTGDVAGELAVSGDLLLVADYLGGLQVINIGDPWNPVLVSSLDPSTIVEDVVISGYAAYVAAGGGGVKFLYLDSDRWNPQIANQNIDTPGYANSVTIHGERLYVTDNVAGVMIFEEAIHGSNLLPSGSVETPGWALGLVVAGKFAYVADQVAGLTILDISDPANPFVVGNVVTPGGAVGVAISGHMVYAACQGSGVQLINVSNPNNPVIVGGIMTTGSAVAVTISGDTAYVSEGSSGVQLFDISNPLAPTLIDAVDTPGSARALVVEGEMAIVADGRSGVQILHARDLANPAMVGSASTPAAAMNVVVDGDLAYVIDSLGSLEILDIQDPSVPAPVGSIGMPPQSSGVAVSGEIAVVVGPSSVQIVDVSVPANPFVISTIDTLYNAYDVEIAGHLVYISALESGYYILDIRDPGSPVLVGTAMTSGAVRDLAVTGIISFAASGAADFELYFTYGNNYPYSSEYFPGEARGIAVGGEYAFVAAGESGLQVVDVSFGLGGNLVGSVDTPGYAEDIVVEGNYAFIADSDGGIAVVDVGDPLNPVLVHSVATPGTARGLCLDGDILYVADTSAGLTVVQIFQTQMDMTNNQGQSLAVDSAEATIVRARMSTLQTGDVGWELSADNGVNWQATPSDNTLIKFANPGTDLKWRSTMSWTFDVNFPSVDQVDVDWFTNWAPITSISDVTGDQGGWLRVNLGRSGYDFAAEDSLAVTGYWVHQRVDNAALTKRVQNEGTIVNDRTKLNIPAEILTLGNIRLLDDRMFILNQGKSLSAMPPGIWEVVGSSPATQQEAYDVLVSTTADSTSNGPVWSVFTVTTHTTTPSIWFSSPPDSAYSIDNNAPEMVQNITAAYQSGRVVLDWDDVPGSDLQYYRIYRDVNPGFIPSAANMVQETSISTWTDMVANPWSYVYQITAVDYAGNESEGAAPDNISGVGDRIVSARTTLMGAVPNPFNPSTALSYELASAGHARLKIYDTAGRLVATLVDEHHDMGAHKVIWDGRDHAGRMAAAGVYLYRLEAGAWSETRRMTLVK